MTIHTGVSTGSAQLLLSHYYGNFWTITARHQLRKYSFREDHRLPFFSSEFTSGRPEGGRGMRCAKKKEGLTTSSVNPGAMGLPGINRRALLFQSNHCPECRSHGIARWKLSELNLEAINSATRILREGAKGFLIPPCPFVPEYRGEGELTKSLLLTVFGTFRAFLRRLRG